MTIEEYFKTQSISKEKNGKKNVLKIVFGILCLLVILFSIYTIFKWCLDNSKIRQINKKIEENISTSNNEAGGELVNPPKDKTSDYYYYTSMPFYQVSISVLKSMNSDTVAYIHIRNTNIDYPVVQGSDNSYYLNHSFNKEKNGAGWVFMDYRNNIDDLDDNTIIYGHSRLNDAMFGTLKNTLSSKWQSDKDNYVIFISTLKENMIFQIFSIYTIKSETYYITPSFKDNIDKQKWIDVMKSRNISIIDTEVDTRDKFLTLSTCQNNQGGRIVVHAKLIKRQKRKN